jgi:ParB family chromosome partitioning protein
LFKEIQQKGYSVRQVEDMIKAYNEGAGADIKAKGSAKMAQTPEFEKLCKRISDSLGTKAKITCSAKGNGKVTLSFKDLDDLKRMVEILS